jgi:hypothetical protein
MANKFNLGRVKENMERLKKELPPLIANQAQTFFTRTFSVGGWDGKPWELPNRKKPGTKEYEYPKKKGLQRRKKPTLVKTGKLRRAVSMSAKVVTWDKISFLVDLPYAARHNEGLKGMPKRQFMGSSKGLLIQQKKLITDKINEIWRA